MYIELGAAGRQGGSDEGRWKGGREQGEGGGGRVQGDEVRKQCVDGARGIGEGGSERRREGATERGRGAINGGPWEEGR